MSKPITMVIESPSPQLRPDQIITIGHYEELSKVPPQKVKVLRRATFAEYVGSIWANPEIPVSVKQEHVAPIPGRYHYLVEILTN